MSIVFVPWGGGGGISILFSYLLDVPLMWVGFLNPNSPLQMGPIFSYILVKGFRQNFHEKSLNGLSIKFIHMQVVHSY